MKFSNTSYVIFFLIIFYPLGALPLILIEIYNKKYYAFNYLAFLMGLLAFLWVPSGDLSRVSTDFENIKNIEFLEIFSVTSFDYLYSLILFVFGRLNLDFAHVRFIICIISYLLFFNVIKKIIKNNTYISSSKLNSFLVFLSFFFLLKFTGFLTGVRFTFAFALFFYGFFSIVYTDNKRGWYFVLLSAFVHFSFWVLILLILFNKFINFKFSRFNIIILISIAFLSSTIFAEFIVDLLPIDDSLKRYLNVYITGHFALEEYKIMSFLFRVSRFLEHFIIYPALLFVLLRKKSLNNYKYFISLVIFLSISFYMNSVFSRYAFISIFLFIIPFFVNWGKPNIYFFRVFFFCSCITYFASIYTVKRELAAGMQYKILYSPMPLIMTSEYDKMWLNENIEENGSMTKFKQ